MHHRIWILASILGLGGFATASCNDDNPGTPATDAGTDAPEDDDVDGGAIPDSSFDAGTYGQALFVGSDFNQGKSELAVMNLGPNAVAGRTLVSDSDAILSTGQGAAFLLERTNGKVDILDRAQPWTVSHSVDIKDAPPATRNANPYAAALTTGTKAYVVRYGSNVAKIVDVATGTVTGGLDFSPFLAAGDPDGTVDLTDVVYDPASHRAYFLLERINQDAYGDAPDYVAPCAAPRAQIVAVDANTDAFVNLHGASDGAVNDGLAIDLVGDNPQSFAADFGSGRLVVVDSGCKDSNTTRRGRGVEAVSIASASSGWLYHTTDLDRVSALVWADATHAFLNKGTSWYSWDPTQTTLGAAVADFPQAAIYDGLGRVVGLSMTPAAAGSDAGPAWSVVSYNVATGELSTIGGNPFQGLTPQYVARSAILPAR